MKCQYSIYQIICVKYGLVDWKFGIFRILLNECSFQVTTEFFEILGFLSGFWRIFKKFFRIVEDPQLARFLKLFLHYFTLLFIDS